MSKSMAQSINTALLFSILPARGKFQWCEIALRICKLASSLANSLCLTDIIQ